MGLYRTIEVEVDVALEDFSDEELIQELEDRNVSHKNNNNVSCEQLLDAWILYRHKFEDLFREYCRDTIGKSF
jgi:hypothetical protein